MRAVLAAVLLSVAASVAPAPAPVAAAESDLTIVSDARYDVLPESGIVRVTADLTIRYRRAETRARRYYVDHAFLAVMPGASGFRVTGDGDPSVRVSKEASTHTLLRINLGERLYGGGTRAVRLRFDLRDPGGSPSRELRIGEALVAFPVWAFASDGAGPSTVSVVMPAGYEVEVGSGPLPDRTVADDGRQVFRSGPIAEPGTFFAYVVGEGPGAFTEERLTLTVAGEPVTLRLRGWSDDPEWTARVRGLLEPAVPALAERIGLPWTAANPLVVEESSSRSTTAYAGRYEPAEGRVEIAYYADTFVILHEAAHAWFNGALLADRWASEGFASLYAEEVAQALGLEVAPDALTDEARAAAVPLNAWDPESDADSEAYGYAAALELARQVRNRAGDEVLRQVWADAAARVGAYQPEGRAAADAAAAIDDAVEPEQAAGPPDWRGLLDLLEERSGTSFEDLWRGWVVRPEDAPLLEARRESRAAYRRTVALAGDWAIPVGVRDALRAWRFETVDAYLADLQIVIGQREALESAANAAGLTVPNTVRDAFEAGRLADASAAAVEQLETVEVIVFAESSRPLEPDPVTQLGLFDQQPDVDLAAAKAAFASGDVAAARSAAADAQAAWDQAWDLGRRRILIALAAGIGLLLLLGVTLAGVRRRRGGILHATERSTPAPPSASSAG